MFIYLNITNILKVTPVVVNFFFIKINNLLTKYTFFKNNLLIKYLYIKITSVYKRIYSLQSIKEIIYLIKRFNIDVKVNNFLQKCFKFIRFFIKLIFILVLIIVTGYFELFVYKTYIFYTLVFFYPNNSYLNVINTYWDRFTELTLCCLEIIFITIRHFIPIISILFDCVYTYIKEFLYQFVQDLFYKFSLVYFFLKERFYNIYCAFIITIEYLIIYSYYYISLFFIYLKDLLISIICYN